MLRKIFFALSFAASFSGFSATWYVATNGIDTNSGSSNNPFATIKRAQTAASSGDTVWLRGGAYFLSNTDLTTTNSAWAIVNNMTKSGISYLAFSGERPVFDFSAVRPNGWRVTAFRITASDCVFKGFDTIGVQITIITNHTQSENFRVEGGNRNRFEQLAMHDGMGIGWYLTSGFSNLVLNCDAYRNRGLDSGSIGNIDGFGAHPSSTSGKGNVFRGCRAWFNSDDGYDCINAFAAVTFDHCWAFYNGYFTNFANSGGDANGIKAGGYGVSGSPFPNPIPRHKVEYCLTVSNRASGFYANHHMGGIDWIHNTAFRNAVNYNMLCNTNNTSTNFDVPGFAHFMKNNLGFSPRSTEVSHLGDAITNDTSYNYFTLPVSVSATDFQALNVNLLTAPRQANGDLPYIAFMQLVGNSDLVNAGTNDTFTFVGTAPDLGAFEYGLNLLSDVSVNAMNGNLVLTGSGGPIGGTNYLMTTTNVTLPYTQWTQIKKTPFDASGSYSITNAILPDDQPRFYRIALP